MKTIKSFETDHDILTEGVYISRKDGDIVTYDLRVIKPNTPPFPSTACMHTVEHIIAVYVRNGEFGKNIVYFGPMGCRTGFYLLTRGLTDEKALSLVKDAFAYAADYEGDIPGATKKECGNYLDHDLGAAKELCREYCNKIKALTVENLKY